MINSGREWGWMDDKTKTKMSKEEIIELLRDWEFINPNLVSDGYGEFPNGYKLTESNLRSLEQKIDEFLKQK